MQLTVEISNYPLTANYIPAIQGFLDELGKQGDLNIITNTLSTQVFGEYDTVMAALQACMKFSFETYGMMVFVCKFLPGDLSPKS
ncbi:hypothetical protein CWE15_11275 [Aliidiomarina taiwanensis]|uniref:Thiamin/hydroxymethyl pyrimidine-binding YkoF putative domain-containing protein n=1 Tax=Aliidiomarina taiwanensis TaxID=946228 RepID=A0A432WTP9_9GAMM|nr:hypothetical protein [Aliidiomarina taiwanensis]RUO37139.1 hypothetical protein CWE15_11275 [Aliidiomarina taiwanensis]